MLFRNKKKFMILMDISLEWMGIKIRNENYIGTNLH